MKIKFSVVGYILGWMEENMKESGKPIIWKDMECIFGMMEESMKESIKMIRSMAMVFISGLMGVSTMAIGLKESNMA